MPRLPTTDEEELSDVDAPQSPSSVKLAELSQDEIRQVEKVGLLSAEDVDDVELQQKVEPAASQGCLARLGAKLKKSWNPLTNIRHLFCPQIHEGQMQTLDGIRGFAMMWVIVVHSWNVLSWDHGFDPDFKSISDSLLMRPIRAGELSVDMFFVLSGFLIAHIMIREHEKTGRVSVLNFLSDAPSHRVGVHACSLCLLAHLSMSYACNAVRSLADESLFINNFAPMFGSCMA